MPTNSTLLKVENLKAGYNGLSILHGVSISVSENELVTIIGPNGSGKSTLLKAIYGLVDVHDGSVTFRGESIVGVPVEKRVGLGLGFMPQTDNVFPSLTINENLLMGLLEKTSLAASRIEFAYEFFPALGSVRNEAAGKLSGGQRQMLAMARALMSGPKLLLLDEPSAGLSPKYAEIIFEHINEIRKQGTAILIVEQNAKVMLSLCDRAYVLATGRNQLEGPGHVLLNDPEVRRLYLGG